MASDHPFTQVEELEAPHEDEGPVRVNAETKTIPALLLVDTSVSMAGCTGDVRTALHEFVVQLLREPLTAEFVRLGIDTFGGDAGTVLPLSAVADPSTRLPDLAVLGGGTNYRAAFDQDHESLHSGLGALRSTESGVRVRIQRPNLFVVTDGQRDVGGPWQPALQRLRRERWCPNVFAFGFGDVKRRVITEIADEGMAYSAADGLTPLTMYQATLRLILASLVSLRSAGAASQAVMAPPTVDPPPTG